MSNALSFAAEEAADRDTRNAERALNRRMKDLKQITHKLEEHLEMLEPLVYKAGLGEISSKTFDTGQKIEQVDKISKSAVEIQQMIWCKLSTDAERICFALTCKSNASMFDYMKTRLPILRKSKPTKLHRLAVLLRLTKWNGVRDYNLCCYCVRYIPGNKGGWGGDSQYLEKAASTKAVYDRGPRCPRCVERGELDKILSKQTYKDYVALAKKYQPRRK